MCVKGDITANRIGLSALERRASQTSRPNDPTKSTTFYKISPPGPENLGTD